MRWRIPALVTFVAVTLFWPQPGPISASGVAAVAAGSASGHTCAVTTAGDLQCWGRNTHGQLGDGRACGIVCVTPVDVLGLESGVVGVAAGWAHTCALTKAGGAKCWGNNFHGQLGNGQLGNFRATPVNVGLLANGVAAVAAGDWHTCAVTTVGAVKCWGENLHGQLGDGTFGTNRPAPVNVLGLSSGVDAVAGGEFHSCALTNAGDVKCWGRNDVGQMGDGTTSSIRTAPADVVDLSGDVIAIAAGGRHTCAVITTGGTKCWGYNAFGQLGDGTTTTRATPVDVLGLASNAIAIGAGHSHTCGVVQCWGSNSSGQLGSTTVETCSTVPCSTSPLTVEAVDSDGDGCTNQAELQTAMGSELTGGLRDPENKWDFYDVNGDKNIDVPSDLLPVVLAYQQGPNDPGGPGPNYSTAKDRGPPIAGAQFAWQRTGPDGHIDAVNDLLPVLLQLVHSCK